MGFCVFFCLCFLNLQSFFAPFISLLAGIGVVYGAFMALAQSNIKKLVAYSSVSHMAYVLLGLFSLNFYGLTGGFYQMLTHAVSASALFLLVGMIYERTHSLNIKDFGGVAQKMPILAIFFIIVSLSSMALPSTGGFISELLVLLGVFNTKNWFPFVLTLSGLVLGASYMLYLIHRVFFGSVAPLCQNMKPLSLREKSLIWPFVLLVFIMGVFPQVFLKYSSSSLKHLQSEYTQNKGVVNE